MNEHEYTRSDDVSSVSPADYILDTVPAVPAVAYDLQVLQALRRLIRATDILSRRLIAQHKVSGPQLVCLHKLLESDGLTVTELSKAVFLSASTVVGILDRLERQDLITRIRSTVDRRKVLIHVSQAGRDLVQDAPSPLQDALRSGLARLPIAHQQVIAESIGQLVDMLELNDLDAAPILETGATLDDAAEVPPDPTA